MYIVAEDFHILDISIHILLYLQIYSCEGLFRNNGCCKNKDEVYQFISFELCLIKFLVCKFMELLNSLDL